jgi:hypothetical protein
MCRNVSQSQVLFDVVGNLARNLSWYLNQRGEYMLYIFLESGKPEVSNVFFWNKLIRFVVDEKL